jgi:hypothetical protein
MLKTKLLLLLAASCGTLTAQTSSPQWNTPKLGVKEVQVPLASLKPSATFKVGGTADWVLLNEDAVWITTTKNTTFGPPGRFEDSAQRIRIRRSLGDSGHP